MTDHRGLHLRALYQRRADRNLVPVRDHQYLVDHDLATGRLARAAEVARGLPPDLWEHQAVAYLTGSPPRGSLSPELCDDRLGRMRLVRIEACRRLEVGDPAGAERVVAACRPDEVEVYFGEWQSIAVSLLASGWTKPWIEAELVAHARRFRDNAGALLRAANLLTSERGAPWLERLAGEVEATGAGGPMPDLMRALMHVRRGRFAESLAALERSRTRGGARPPPPEAVAEVLGRPLWLRALGAWRDDALERRIRADPGPGGTRQEQDYWRRLATGELAGASDVAARLHEALPASPIWGLSRLWHARMVGDRVAFQEWASRLRAGVRFRGGPWLLDEIERTSRW